MNETKKVQFTLQIFGTTYDSTVMNSYREPMVIDGESCMVEILDIAGQEEYTALRDQWIRDGEGFLVVYSINGRVFFNRVHRFINQIFRVKRLEKSNILPSTMLVGHDMMTTKMSKATFKADIARYQCKKAEPWQES
jgi:GTPase KRas protein